MARRLLLIGVTLFALVGCVAADSGYGSSYPNPSAGPYNQSPYNQSPYDRGPRSPNPGGAYAG